MMSAYAKGHARGIDNLFHGLPPGSDLTEAFGIRGIKTLKFPI